MGAETVPAPKLNKLQAAQAPIGACRFWKRRSKLFVHRKRNYLAEVWNMRRVRIGIGIVELLSEVDGAWDPRFRMH
jgi:hypothetical protein